MPGETVQIRLPTLHAGQVRAFRLPARYKAIRCGRRWGKTALSTTLSCDAAIKGQFVGIFAPDYKRLSEPYRENREILDPIVALYSQDGSIVRCRTGGRIDFWSLEDENAGRSRKYHLVLIDEAAYTKANMTAIWERSIEPTLFDYGGRCYALSNTNGSSEENFFWRICNVPKYGFAEYHAPTHDNPLLPLIRPGESVEDWQARREEEFTKLKREKEPRVYQQEHLAEFVNWDGDAFFAQEKLLVNGIAPPIPSLCDGVFAVIDSATKTGREHDGTAVVYFALNQHFSAAAALTVLDWDVVQIEGALLETWLPSVFTRLEELARLTKARMGAIGTWIEDKASGMILLQQAKRRGWNAHPINSKLTAVGKNERALSISGYVFQDKVKIAAPAFDKTTIFKGISRNHLVTQIRDFRVSDTDRDRSDDLLDCFTYGIAIGLGNNEGF